MSGVRKIAMLLGALSLAITLATSPGSAEKTPYPLPDITGWNLGDRVSMELETPSEELGCRVEGIYKRRTDNHSVFVVLVKGPGTLWQGLPEGEINTDDGPIGSGATFSTLKIGGRKAVIECHPLTGRVLVVEVSPDFTLTFETRYEDVELERFALAFLEKLDQ